MINRVEDYLAELRKELAGCDPATIRDAQSDSEEHLRNAVEKARQSQPDISEADALPAIVQNYGSPDEVAGAYRDFEKRAMPSPVTAQEADRRGLVSKFFGVVTEPRAWGSLFYMFLSLGTGIAYFTWAITGLSLSAGLIVLIIGLPFAALFLLSIRGLAILEGRLVEALLGVRMPRRPPFQERKAGLWARFKALVTDRYTWYSMLYMIMQLGFGIAYFTVFTVLMAVSVGLVIHPAVELFSPNHTFIDGRYLPLFSNGWLMTLGVIVGIAMFFGTMHLAKWTGKLHGAWAKLMLVRI